MGMPNFEEIEAWQPARKMTQNVYRVTKEGGFAKDFALRDQIRKATGSSMHNIVEGFDAESNSEFVRFLRYAKRSCNEVQSELYVALDEAYVTKQDFDDIYEQARQTRAAIRGFMNYLVKFESRGIEAPLSDDSRER